MKDLIIVGRGLAAMVLAHTLRQKGVSFYLIGKNDLSRSSRVAAGIWNPVVFKRMTKSWMADALIPHLQNFYSECEAFLNVSLIKERSLYKLMASESEKSLWLKKSKNELDDYLSQQIRPINDYGVSGTLNEEAGEVLQSGNLDIPLFLDASDLAFKEVIHDELFSHDQLYIEKEVIQYHHLTAKGIVFCEGHLICNNPLFSFIPMKPVKGEVLTIRSHDLKFSNAILNRDGFVMDLGNDLFKVGATYNWEDLSEQPREGGKALLIQKSSTMLSGPFDIIEHTSGIRPSTIDRRPVTGPHPIHQNVHVFNGLGTKGVMLAPYFADNFVNFLLGKAQLNSEVNVKRFYPTS